jgi:hypothetical protein
VSITPRPQGISHSFGEAVKKNIVADGALVQFLPELPLHPHKRQMLSRIPMYLIALLAGLPLPAQQDSSGRTNPYGIASLFIPARAADVIINGKKAAGRPFPTRRGRMENSTAFLAFSETWVR